MWRRCSGGMRRWRIEKERGGCRADNNVLSNRMGWMAM